MPFFSHAQAIKAGEPVSQLLSSKKMALPILKLPTELQLAIIDKVVCTHDAFNLVMELDSYYRSEEFLAYLMRTRNNVTIAPWLSVRSYHHHNVWIQCYCDPCCEDRREGYARVMCEEYDYHN